jgi:hypothetical protein
MQKRLYYRSIWPKTSFSLQHLVKVYNTKCYENLSVYVLILGNREMLWQIDMTSTYGISCYFVQTFFLLLTALLKITREMEMYDLHSV